MKTKICWYTDERVDDSDLTAFVNILDSELVKALFIVGHMRDELDGGEHGESDVRGSVLVKSTVSIDQDTLAITFNSGLRLLLTGHDGLSGTDYGEIYDFDTNTVVNGVIPETGSLAYIMARPDDFSVETIDDRVYYKASAPTKEETRQTVWKKARSIEWAVATDATERSVYLAQGYAQVCTLTKSGTWSLDSWETVFLPIVNQGKYGFAAFASIAPVLKALSHEIALMKRSGAKWDEDPVTTIFALDAAVTALQNESSPYCRLGQPDTPQVVEDGELAYVIFKAVEQTGEIWSGDAPTILALPDGYAFLEVHVTIDTESDGLLDSAKFAVQIEKSTDSGVVYARERVVSPMNLSGDLYRRGAVSLSCVVKTGVKVKFINYESVNHLTLTPIVTVRAIKR